ncbi:MAG: hypothetical protein ABI852_12500 [Gemmatimonadaceae bacterium]
MSIRMRISVALVLLGVVGATSPAILGAQDSAAVFVMRDRVIIDVQPPKLRVRPPRTAQLGFYSWRIDIKAGDGVSLAFTADTAMRVTGLRDIARASSLRRCADPKDFATLRCRIPMSDSVTVRGDGLRFIVRDSSIVALVRKARPTTMWASTFEPNGQFRVDRISVRYADGDGDEPASALRNQE